MTAPKPREFEWNEIEDANPMQLTGYLPDHDNGVGGSQAGRTTSQAQLVGSVTVDMDVPWVWTARGYGLSVDVDNATCDVGIDLLDSLIDRVKQVNQGGREEERRRQ